MWHWLWDAGAVLAVAMLALVLLWLLRPGGVLVALLALAGCAEPTRPAAGPDPILTRPDPRACPDVWPQGVRGCLDCHDDRARSF